MNKKLFFFVIFLLSILVFSASADWYISSEAEWTRTYARSKLSKTVDVYSQTGRYITTLSAGTFVKNGGKNNDGTTSIYWWENGSSNNSGRVSSDAVRTAVVQYWINGELHGYQELKFFDMVRNGEIDPSTVKFNPAYAYLNDVYNTPWASGKNEADPSPTATPTPEADNTQEDTSKPSATKAPSSSATKAPSTRKPSSSSSSKKTAAPRVTATPAPVKSTVMYQGQAAQIDILSSYESEITVGGEKITVLTSKLEFESTAKEEERLAVIYAPKTGKATLRTKASQSAKMVKNCKAGRYALVLEKGKNFSKIYYNNAVGYIRTDCLKFYPIATEPYAEGILSLNGYTNGQAEINIRNKAEHGTHISGTYKTGTVVRVIEIGDTWTEVEIDRIRGYIQTKFLTMQE